MASKADGGIDEDLVHRGDGIGEIRAGSGVQSLILELLFDEFIRDFEIRQGEVEQTEIRPFRHEEAVLDEGRAKRLFGMEHRWIAAFGDPGFEESMSIESGVGFLQAGGDQKRGGLLRLDVGLDGSQLFDEMEDLFGWDLELDLETIGLDLRRFDRDRLVIELDILRGDGFAAF